ncbi:MAG: hypothetical protein IH820_16380 [Bacteroidetes bacterium]|nr:hypothetical protein [Bacteroidota bacterium]
MDDDSTDPPDDGPSDDGGSDETTDSTTPKRRATAGSAIGAVSVVGYPFGREPDDSSDHQEYLALASMRPIGLNGQFGSSTSRSGLIETEALEQESLLALNTDALWSQLDDIGHQMAQLSKFNVLLEVGLPATGFAVSVGYLADLIGAG